jgi:hypothetical protein
MAQIFAKVNVPHPYTQPLVSARWAAAAAFGLAHGVQHLVRSLRQHLLPWQRLLVDAQSRPTTATSGWRAVLAPASSTRRVPTLDQAAWEAARVRALASQYARSEPGFAADLYAAADRHQSLAEEAVATGAMAPIGGAK